MTCTVPSIRRRGKARALHEVRPECVYLWALPQTLEGLDLDLPDALAGNAVIGADGVQGLLIARAEPEPTSLSSALCGLWAGRIAGIALWC